MCLWSDLDLDLHVLRPVLTCHSKLTLLKNMTLPLLSQKKSYSHWIISVILTMTLFVFPINMVTPYLKLVTSAEYLIKYAIVTTSDWLWPWTSCPERRTWYFNMSFNFPEQRTWYFQHVIMTLNFLSWSKNLIFSICHLIWPWTSCPEQGIWFF